MLQLEILTCFITIPKSWSTLMEGTEEKQHAIYGAVNARSKPGSYILYTQWWSKMHKQRKLKVTCKHTTLTYIFADVYTLANVCFQSFH